MLTDVNADFQEGRAHTAFAMGKTEAEDGSSDEALRLVVAVDGTAEEAPGGAASGGTGNGTADNEWSMDDGSTNGSSMGTETETPSA